MKKDEQLQMANDELDKVKRDFEGFVDSLQDEFTENPFGALIRNLDDIKRLRNEKVSSLNKKIEDLETQK
jgi:hypothetical protein